MKFTPATETAQKRPLTAKQEMFVLEYLIDLNATQAAIRAGYSAKNADKIAHQLLGKNIVREAVQEQMDKRASKTEITAEQVLQDIRDIGNEARKAADFGAALKSRELIGKHLKLFTDRIEIQDDSGLAARMQNARQRTGKNG